MQLRTAALACALVLLSHAVAGQPSDDPFTAPRPPPGAAAPPPDPFTAPRPDTYGPHAKEDDYAAVMDLSFLFYEGQMSGNLPAWNRLLANKPGGYKRSAHLNDGKAIGADLSGGFYDAGDYLKCPHALAWSMANLALGMMEFRDAYLSSQQWDTAQRLLKWGVDWLVKAHVKASDNPADNVFVGQISARPDHHYFGRPEQATNERPIYVADAANPGADLASEYAAAFAAAACLFRGVGEREYAAQLYKHAQQAYAFAKAYPKNWKTPAGVFQAYSSYWPDGYTAQYAWAAAWMCKYDGNACTEAIATFEGAMRINNMRYGLGYDYDAVMPGAAALVVSIKLEPVASTAKQYLTGYVLSKWEDTSSMCPKESYANVCYTPKGLAYYADWGTLRGTANMMFVAMLMAKHSDNGGEAHACWVRSQMRYMLGTTTGKSYLIGYGPDQPKRPHHRLSACSPTYAGPCKANNNGTCCAGESNDPSAIAAGRGCCNQDSFMSSAPAHIVIKGGLVGGPDQQDHFPDIRNDYQRSEVALDFNAGFTGAAAGLTSFQHARKLQSCPVTGGGSSGGGGGGGGGGGDSTPGCKKVADYQQCGGLGNTCPSELHGSCVDGPWTGYCCPSGQTCQRNNEYHWSCKGL